MLSFPRRLDPDTMLRSVHSFGKEIFRIEIKLLYIFAIICGTYSFLERCITLKVSVWQGVQVCYSLILNVLVMALIPLGFGIFFDIITHCITTKRVINYIIFSPVATVITFGLLYSMFVNLQIYNMTIDFLEVMGLTLLPTGVSWICHVVITNRAEIKSFFKFIRSRLVKKEG